MTHTPPREAGRARDRRARRSLTDRLAAGFARTRAGGAVTTAITALRARAVPRHWTHGFGIVPLALLVVLIVSGAVLTIFYAPSSERVVYAGPYAPLRGTEVSAAFDSVMRLSFEIPAGLLLRQVHH